VRLKLAVAGKGGVGKTTLSAALARALARRGEPVMAVDADPNNCLGRALGFPESTLRLVKPLSEMREELAALAGTSEGGGFFSINPPVEQLLSDYQIEHDGVSLLVMGTIDEPGAGCVCPESAILKALVRHLVGLEQTAVIMDMEAGLEHLGRGTARHIGALLIVTEPAPASARTATRIGRLARGLGLQVAGVVINKANSPGDEEKVRPYLEEVDIIASLPFDPVIAASETAVPSGPYAQAVEKLLADVSAMAAGARA
jgi:CO dehydrogenase maturation factor